MIRAVTLIPGTGEFVYATEPISRGSGGNTASENVHTTNAVPDIIAALDQLQASAPNLISISLDTNCRTAYGGTPADFAVVQAIQEIKARGLRVTFYPFLLMDIPAGNSLPDPYSDNAAMSGQATYPWRGRITCSPAAGYAGSVDKTSSAGTQVSAFFGNAQVSDFAVSGEVVSWTGVLTGAIAA